MKILSNIFYSIFIILLLGVAGLFLVPLLPFDNNIEIKIVESGSMEPAIMTGSLVVIMPATDYVQNDVITFESTGADVPTTHRIVSIEEKEGTLWFTTKGDANEEADTAVTPYNGIIGKVMFAVPYLGFILDFARQPMGFGLLIVLPALMIILGEIEKIWKEIRKKKTEVEQKEETITEPITPSEIENVRLRKSNTSNMRMMDIASPVRYTMHDVLQNTYTLIVPRFSSASITHQFRYNRQTQVWATSVVIVLVSIFFASLSFIGSTVSYFNDVEVSEDNSMVAQILDFEVSVSSAAYGFEENVLDTENGALVSLIAPVEGSTDALYRIHAEQISGTVLFCDAILADIDAPFIYGGALLSLNQESVVFGGEWSFVITLDSDVVGLTPGEECVIDLVYTAWDADVDEGTGYSDVERVQLTFTAPGAQLQMMQSLSVPEEIPEELEQNVEEIPETEEIEEPVEEELPEEGQTKAEVEFVGPEEIEEVEKLEEEEKEEIEETEEVEEIEETEVV